MLALAEMIDRWEEGSDIALLLMLDLSGWMLTRRCQMRAVVRQLISTRRLVPQQIVQMLARKAGQSRRPFRRPHEGQVIT